MKIVPFIACAALGAGAWAQSASAQVITSWTFENAGADVTGPTASIASDGGTVAGIASGVHAGAGTVFSSPAGNGSANSFSANTWAVGDYWQFTSSSLGFSDIAIQWDQTGSSTGPRDFNLFYSTDGTNYTQLGATLTVLLNGAPNTAWNGTTSSPVYTFGPIAAPAALDNQATIFFRLIDASTTAINGTTVAAGGTDRIDNVVISSIPTPGAISLIGAAGLLAARRRRN